MKNRRNLKIATLLFALTFVVGTAFAATNGMLAFGGTVRINSAAVTPDPIVRLEMTYTSVWVSSIFADSFRGSSEIILDENGHQTLSFDIELLDPTIIYRPGLGNLVPGAQLNLHLRNTGDVPVIITEFENNSHWGIGSIDSPLIRPGVVLEPGQFIQGSISVNSNRLMQLYRETGELSFNSNFVLLYEQAH